MGIDSSAGVVIPVAIAPYISYQTASGVFDLGNADEVMASVVVLHT